MKIVCTWLCFSAAMASGCAKPPGAPAGSGGDSSAPAVATAAGKTPTSDKPNATADEVTVQITDFDGIQKLIAGKRGKVVVMDCWTTFCGPCMKEFPGLVELHKQYGPEKVACVSLSFNYDGGKKETPEEHREEVLDFLRSQHATFDNIIASVPAETLYRKLGFKSASVPAIFVYDREGNVAGQFEGPDAKYSEVRTRVVELIGGAK